MHDDHTCLFPCVYADDTGFECGPCEYCGEPAPDQFKPTSDAYAAFKGAQAGA